MTPPATLNAMFWGFLVGAVLVAAWVVHLAIRIRALERRVARLARTDPGQSPLD